MVDLEDPYLSLSTIMSRWPETIAVFLRHKMLCVGCVVTPFHTIVDACLEHGLDEQQFRVELRHAICA